MDIKLICKIAVYVIACEALVQLWFNAAPLQPIRKFLIKITPFFTSKEQGNLFECRYCISVWIGFLLVATYALNDRYCDFFILGLVIHRLSNFVHLIFSFIKDLQFDIRVNRRR